MRKITGILIFCLACTISVQAQDYIDLIQDGNAAFAEKEYQEALNFYKSAEEALPDSPELEYNIACALSMTNGLEEAVDRFTKALNTTDVELEANAHYNLGNTYYSMEDYQNAIKSYEQSLTLNPDDMDAKYNLELARRMLKENSKPEQNQDDKCDPENCDKPEHKEQHEKEKQEQQKQDQKDQEEQQQQEQGEDGEGEDQQQQQPSDEEQDKNQDQQQKSQAQQQKQLSKEDAERILNALRDDEADQQKKVKRRMVPVNYSGKDW